MNAYRHELKYLLHEADAEELCRVLQAVLARDIHAGAKGQYDVRSLYFDDMYQTAYREKLDGVERRKKYRVRVYDCQDDHIALECKYKRGAMICKKSLPLTRREYDRLLAGDLGFLLGKPQALAGEFFADARGALLRPCVIVAYDREAFVNRVGSVRVTFDRSLCAVAPGHGLFCPTAPSYPALPPGQLVLEVKYSGILPESLRRVFAAYSFVRTSASKFCLCADLAGQVTGL